MKLRDLHIFYELFLTIYIDTTKNPIICENMKLRPLYEMNLNTTIIGAFPFEKGVKIGEDFLQCKFYMQTRDDFM